MNIGIDFGTTNSIISFFDDNKKAYDFIKFGNQTLDFFPTMIAYKKAAPTDVIIGEAAKLKQFSADYDIYNLFKFLLGEQANYTNGRAKSPLEVTKDFFKKIISETECIRQTDITNIVLTVPDIWKNDDKNKIAVDNLINIFSELGFDTQAQIIFESEPVAATAYYCKEICNGAYRGYCLVIDYGGGTLDLTLCKVGEDNQITVLRRCGDGGSNGYGCAGVAFDRALTRRIIKKYDLDAEKYKDSSPFFVALCNDVENNKIACCETTRKVLNKYYSNYDTFTRQSYTDGVAFTVTDSRNFGADYEVLASDIAETFEEVNADALTEALDTMKNYCTELGVDINSQDSFRVLTVGGFSNLYCVEHICRESFDSSSGLIDSRFDTEMRKGNRTATAIANGAAIISNNQATVYYNSQTDIGFYYYKSCERYEALLIKRDSPLDDYKEPVYFNGHLYLSSDDRSIKICLFFDFGDGKIPYEMDETFFDLCPNRDMENNYYQIGFSISRHRIPLIHIKDSKGEVNTHSLHKIINKVSLNSVD